MVEDVDEAVNVAPNEVKVGDATSRDSGAWVAAPATLGGTAPVAQRKPCCSRTMSDGRHSAIGHGQ